MNLVDSSQALFCICMVPQEDHATLVIKVNQFVGFRVKVAKTCNAR